MSYANLVLSQVQVPLTAAATTVTLLDIGAPYQLPPANGGILVLSDSPAKPTVVEIIKYTSRTGLILSGVTRGQEGTVPTAWVLPTFSLMALTAEDFQTQLDSKANLASPAMTGTPTMPTAAPGANTLQGANAAFVQQEIAALINAAPGALNTLDELAAAMGDDANFAATVTTALAGKEPSIALGTALQYRRGDKTLANFMADVRATVLAGYLVGTNAVVAATDTVMGAIAKLQAQVSTKQANLGYTPVQQGTGLGGQTSSVVKIGYTADGQVKLTVDSTDFGGIAFVNQLANAATITATQTGVASALVQRDVAGGIHAVNIELGAIGTAGSPILDFHSGATAVDYDTRIISDIPNGAIGGGRMSYIANGGHVFTGSINSSGNVNAKGGVLGSYAAAAATNAHLWLYGEAGQTRGVVYAGADNWLRFQAGSYSCGYWDTAGNLYAAGTFTSGSLITSTGNMACKGGSLYTLSDGAVSVGFITANAATWRGRLRMESGDSNLYFDTVGGVQARIQNDGSFVASSRVYTNSGNSWLDTDGNVYGGAFGGYLTTYLNSHFLQIGNIPTQLGAIGGGGVGAYCFMRNMSGATQGLGVMFSAASLQYADDAGNNFGNPTGTWRCMGAVAAGACAIFLRVS